MSGIPTSFTQLSKPQSSVSSNINATPATPSFLQGARVETSCCSPRVRSIFLNIATLGIRAIVHHCQATSVVGNVQWNNQTSLHRSGVCEAATSLWLARIASNGERGLYLANRLQPEDCDALQTRVENEGWTRSLNLVDELPPNVFLHEEDSMFNGIDSNIPNAIKGGVTGNSSVSDLLGVLDANDFFYIDATQNHGNGHAMAVFHDGQDFHFFDPNRGIFHGSQQNIENEINRSISCWENVTVHQGHIN